MCTRIWYEYSYGIGFTRPSCRFEAALAVASFGAYEGGLGGSGCVLVGEEEDLPASEAPLCCFGGLHLFRA
jgi:hypothetical protein